LAPRSKRRESFLSPTRSGFLLAFAHPIAVAFNGGDVSVMEQTIQQRDDTGGVGKDFVPFFEWPIGSQDDWLAFITPVDDFGSYSRPRMTRSTGSWTKSNLSA
jgi:hypothetical protein